MNTSLSSFDIVQKTIALFKERWRSIQPFFGLVFLLFWMSNLVRAFFPGVYVFDPFDMGWLLIPEALVFGPVVALMHHRVMATGIDFAWSRDALVVKLLKAAAYYYVLLIFFQLGHFVTTQAVPALLVGMVGPSMSGLVPVIIGVGYVLFLLVYVRLVLVYPVLAGEEREPLMVSMGLTKGKTRQIVSCLLLLAAPVLIPWIAANVFGGDWLDPTRGPDIRIIPIITRSLLQTMGVIVISTGVCVIYKSLIAQNDVEKGDTD